MPTIGSICTVADNVEAEFSLGAFNRPVCFSHNRSIAFCIEFEVVDQRFHGRVDFSTGWGSNLSICGAIRSLGQSVHRLSNKLTTLLHLGNSDKESVVNVTALANRNRKIKVFVTAVGITLSQIPSNSTSSGDRTATTQVQGLLT